MASLHRISLFVCIFLLLAAKSYGQNAKKYFAENSLLLSQARDTEQLDNNSDGEDQKLRAIAARDNQINSLLAEAVELYKEKQLPQAIELFNQVIRLDAENSSAHFSLGIALEASGDLNQAVNQYQIAHDLEPNNKEYHQAIIKAKKELNQHNQKPVEDSKWPLLANEAAEAFKSGRYEDALAAYQAIEKNNPNLALPKYNIGTIYLIQKKPNDALPYYKSAHKLEPNNQQYSDSFEKLKESIKQAQALEKQEHVSKVRTSTKSNQSNGATSVSTTEKKDLITLYGLRVKAGKGGLAIEAILIGSRAAQVGLQPGDTITVIDGLKIKKPPQLERMFESKPGGQRFQLLVIRRGQTGQILF